MHVLSIDLTGVNTRTQKYICITESEVNIRGVAGLKFKVLTYVYRVTCNTCMQMIQIGVYERKMWCPPGSVLFATIKRDMVKVNLILMKKKNKNRKNYIIQDLIYFILMSAPP